jgi:hypothetical protein
MGDLGKRVVVAYVASECDRQLFLELGHRDPAWINPLQSPRSVRRPPGYTELLTRLGHEYEQAIYDRLVLLPGARSKRDWTGSVATTYVSPGLLGALHVGILAGGVAILLEHQFKNISSFVDFLFSPKPGGLRPNPDVEDFRPDILVVRKGDPAKHYRELLPGGTTRDVPAAELATRLAITVHDVKRVHQDKIGKKQFTEIFYYAYVIAFYLDFHGLADRYFMCIDGNSIFPDREPAELATIVSLDTFDALAIPVSWDASHRIFLGTIATMRDLWALAPCGPSSIRLKITPACAYCYFVEDCKWRLGMDGVASPGTWAVDLLPSTPTSIKEQLRDLGMDTVADVAANVAAASSGMNPDPITAERPLLQLKADALVSGAITSPAAGTVYSYAIPAFTPLAVTFAVESDPAHDHVYVVAIEFDASTAPNAYYAGLFDDWWVEWEDALANGHVPDLIKQHLDLILPEEISVEEIEAFSDAMAELGGTAGITLPDKIATPPVLHARFRHELVAVGQSLDNADEESLAKAFVRQMHALLVVANTIEERIEAEGTIKDWWTRPDLGIFYWGEDQLANIELMIERHVHALLADPVLGPWLEEIVGWITPSESEVTHPYQHKKIYDLKAFAQATLGLPCVINYTWQDVAKAFDPTFFTNPKFWVQHYDYFDYRFWHETLDTAPFARPAMVREIEHQVGFKMHELNTIRYKLQARGRASISSHAKPVRAAEYMAVPIGSAYHPVAHVWYLYSRLNGAAQEMDADFTRTTFPDRAIGKLDAARITVPSKVADPATRSFHFEFSIPEPSSNMKIKEGDKVLAIPEEKRDLKLNKMANTWCVTIDELSWDHATKSYNVTTKEVTEKSPDILAKFVEEFDDVPTSTQWFLYPFAYDNWSPVMYNEKGTGLLDQCAFGRGWLGARLAWLWGIRLHPVLAWPASWRFEAPEISLFAPGLLATGTDPPDITRFDSNLDKRPDPSQVEAINRALHELIYGIQGPPGTGKSQTITALMNEFHVRRLASGIRQTWILVTAFSYAALRVLIGKVLANVDPAGNISPIGQFQLVYMRSESQDPYPDPRVTDVLRKGSTWKVNGQGNTLTAKKQLENLLAPTRIVFANAYTLHHVIDIVDRDTFSFDMIVVDEASQLPVDYLMASLQHVRKVRVDLRPTGVAFGSIVTGEPIDDPAPIENIEVASALDPDAFTKVVIVGDNNQLLPVQQVKPPEKLDKVLGCLFSYYVTEHGIPNMQLLYNYRSHVDIVEFTRLTGMYADLKPNPVPGVALQTLTGNLANVQEPWAADVLAPSRVVCTIIHERRHEVSVSPFEAEMAASIVLSFYDSIAPATAEEEDRFWTDRVGIVAPHNAQGRIIIRKIYDGLAGSGARHTLLAPHELMAKLKATVYSVEKFQGSDRELIVASYGISDRDQIAAEEEFIYDLNRFNVLTSRAKHKIVVICSKELLSYIPTDREIMGYAEKLHTYAFHYCNSMATLLPANELGGLEAVEFRWHDSTGTTEDPLDVRLARHAGKVSVTFPLHPRYEPTFRQIPAGIGKGQLPSDPGTEAWEFDEGDLQAIKGYVPVPIAWLRNASTATSRAAAPPQKAPAKKAAKKIKQGTVGL